MDVRLPGLTLFSPSLSLEELGALCTQPPSRTHVSKDSEFSTAGSLCFWDAEERPEDPGAVDQWEEFYSDVEGLLDLLRLGLVRPLVEREEVFIEVTGLGTRTNHTGDYVQVPREIMGRMAECGADFLFDVYGRDGDDND